MDGSIWEIRKGKDFTTSRRNVHIYLLQKARSGGMRLKSDLPKDKPDVIIFQFQKAKRT